MFEIHLGAHGHARVQHLLELFRIHLQNLIDLGDPHPPGNVAFLGVNGAKPRIHKIVLIHTQRLQSGDRVTKGGAVIGVEHLHEAALHLVAHNMLPPARLVMNLADIKANNIGEEPFR